MVSTTTTTTTTRQSQTADSAPGVATLKVTLSTRHFLVAIHIYSVYTVSQKKQDTKLLPITPPNINRFSDFFTHGLRSKFATKSCFNILPRLKHVATLPCEI